MHSTSRVLLGALLLVFCPASFAAAVDGGATARIGNLQSPNPNLQVVINEIHSDPDVKTMLVEFVELHNPTGADIDLSGWSFTDGVFYTFPPGSTLRAGGYIIVAQNPDHVYAKWSAGRTSLPAGSVFGPFAGKLANEGERVVLRDADGAVADEVEYQLGFPWPTVGDPVSRVQTGTGASMQLVNPAFDNDLAGNWRSSLPTPAEVNKRVLADNIGPCIRQVKHAPQQPYSGQVVTVTAKITDDDGVASVRLQCQLVDPGHYIRYQYSDGNNQRLEDPEYETNWADIEMNDDGLAGDDTAGDHIYTAQVPAAVQTHRRLVRYRIVAEDHAGFAVRVPYSDDPQPNFAYFVYDGVPAWSGAIRPGSANAAERQVVTYGTDVMRSLPVYHLIAKNEDVEDCQFNPIPDARCNEKASWYQWSGTLVYDGVVYDHIWYRARGGWAAYEFGKNRWKFDFNRGHYFQARDDYGNEYGTTWDKLNFSACFQFSGTRNRGEHGMYEAVTARLMNLAGAPCFYTNWLQFRVIDDERESGPTQYDGDFWGLYLAIEQPDGRFLDERGLPDGNLYKMYFPCSGNTGNKNNQGPTQVTDHSDVIAFCNAYQSYPSDRQWWERNTNLEAYYNYRIVCDAVHHYDLTDRWNCFYYANPETGRWWMLPWDFDHSWDSDIYTDDDEYWKQVLDRRFFQGHNVGTPSTYHRFPDCIITFQNRLRELSDLLLNADECGRLIDEYAAIIADPATDLSFVEADRALWDRHPRNRHPGTYYQSSPTRDFEGMVYRMKQFISPTGWGGSNLARMDDDEAIPHTPVVTSLGPADFPADTLIFEASDFSDPQGDHTFAAVKWRIAEVSAGARYEEPAAVQVIVPEESQWKYFKGTDEPSAGTGLWRQVGFNDSAWLQGQSSIGYGETFVRTSLDDMRGNYSTIYLRKKFELAGLADIGQLNVEVKFDDGVNVWINNTNVVSDNVPGMDLPHDAVTSNRTEDHEFTSYSVAEPADVLVEGTNVIAAQVVNQSLGGSSDCFFDLRLTVREPQEEPDAPAPPRERAPGKYEIDALWESPEIERLSDVVRIPASVVEPGGTYRVRCRMKDNTGRWSHWSAPVQFVAGEPMGQATPVDLRITELMYNPPAPPAGDPTDKDDFEFVELQNVGAETLDLSSVSFTEGIAFDFKDGAVTVLAPGAFVLVVKNITAFESRYGSGVSHLIAGEYAGRLSNGGEKIVLIDFWEGTILEFEYSDDWYDETDGQGYSLTVKNPFGTDPGDWGARATWQPGPNAGGSPGTQ